MLKMLFWHSAFSTGVTYNNPFEYTSPEQAEYEQQSALVVVLGPVGGSVAPRNTSVIYAYVIDPTI